MECKASVGATEIVSGLIGIYPEWNVKNSSRDLIASNILYWNISRMECKEQTSTTVDVILSIGIYPEWNVKIGEREIPLR